MGLSINNNISALNTARQMSKAQGELGKTFEKLSTGLRINRAADDAGRFKIAEKFTSQIKGLGQAIRNANDGISLVQVAEGALNETTSILQRMRELSVQSANGTYTTSDRESLQDEMEALKSEVNRIAGDTTFNGRKILDGSYSSQFQIGSDSGQTIAVAIDSATTNDFGQIASSTGAGVVSAAGISGSDLTINGKLVNASSLYAAANGRAADSAWAKARAVNASNANVQAEAQTTTVTSGLIAAPLTGQSLTINGVQILNNENVADQTAMVDAINRYSGTTGISAAATSGDTSVTLTAADGRNIDITAATGASNPFTVATNRGSLKLTSNEAISIDASGGIIGFSATQNIGLDSSTIEDVDITTIAGASEAISRIDAALGTVSSRRGSIGAVQNRLESTISNLSNVHENVSAARSRLLDVDFATETLNMTKGLMLQQAGAAVLTQAKASSQVVLSLLQ